MSKIIKRSREHLATVHGSELKAIVTNEGFEELFQQRQDILKRMNAAKIKAVNDVTKLFQPELEQLDNQYSFMLSMIGDNAED